MTQFPSSYKPKILDDRIRRVFLKQLAVQIENMPQSKNSSTESFARLWEDHKEAIALKIRQEEEKISDEIALKEKEASISTNSKAAISRANSRKQVKRQDEDDNNTDSVFEENSEFSNSKSNNNNSNSNNNSNNNSRHVSRNSSHNALNNATVNDDDYRQQQQQKQRDRAASGVTDFDEMVQLMDTATIEDMSFDGGNTASSSMSMSMARTIETNPVQRQVKSTLHPGAITNTTTSSSALDTLDRIREEPDDNDAFDHSSELKQQHPQHSAKSSTKGVSWSGHAPVAAENVDEDEEAEFFLPKIQQPNPTHSSHSSASGSDSEPSSLATTVTHDDIKLPHI